MAEANAAVEDDSPKESVRRDDLPYIEPIHPEVEEISSPEFEDGSYLDGISSIGGYDSERPDGLASHTSVAATAAASIEDALARAPEETEPDSNRSLPPLPGAPKPATSESATSSLSALDGSTTASVATDVAEQVQAESKPSRNSALPPVPGRKNKVDEAAKEAVVEPKSIESAVRPDTPTTARTSETEPSTSNGKSSTYSGSMPVRPDGLPRSAEYDPDTGQWLLHGAPIGDTLAPLSN
jgi:hypothetical protein